MKILTCDVNGLHFPLLVSGLLILQHLLKIYEGLYTASYLVLGSKDPRILPLDQSDNSKKHRLSCGIGTATVIDF